MTTSSLAQVLVVMWSFSGVTSPLVWSYTLVVVLLVFREVGFSA